MLLHNASLYLCISVSHGSFGTPAPVHTHQRAVSDTLNTVTGRFDRGCGISFTHSVNGYLISREFETQKTSAEGGLMAVKAEKSEQEIIKERREK